MMKSPLSIALGSRISRTRDSLEFLVSEISSLNDRSPFLKLLGYVNEIVAKSVLSDVFDTASFADEVSAIRSVLSLTIVDEYDNILDEKSPSLLKVKSAAGLAIANLDGLLSALALAGIRPSNPDFSSVVGRYVSPDDVTSDVAEITVRLNAIEELLSTILANTSDYTEGTTETQRKMFAYFAEQTSRKIAVAKGNLETPYLIDIVALLRIVEQIIRSARAFSEGARQMLASITVTARSAARTVWEKARALGESTKKFIQRLMNEEPQAPDPEAGLVAKYLLGWEATKAILGSDGDLPSRLALLGYDLDQEEIKIITSSEMAYLIAASSLPVVSGRIWPNIVRYARYLLETISAERIGIETARRLHYAEDLSISKEISNQRCILFESTKPEGCKYDAGSWYSANLGVAVNSTKDDREDEVYDVAVALDLCKDRIKGFDTSILAKELRKFVALNGISPERKIMALVLLYESKGADILVVEGVRLMMEPVAAPALLYGMLKSVLVRSNIPSDYRISSILTNLQSEATSLIQNVVGLWISDGLVSGTEHQFRAAFEREWTSLAKK